MDTYRWGNLALGREHGVNEHVDGAVYYIKLSIYVDLISSTTQLIESNWESVTLNLRVCNPSIVVNQ